MKKVTGIIVSIVFLLTACSSLNDVPQIDLSTLALPGAQGNSWNTTHIYDDCGSGVICNGHRATVVGKRTTSSSLTIVADYQPDSYIPVDSYFSVDLSGFHHLDKVKVTVSPGSFSCTWQINGLQQFLNIGQIIHCSPSSSTFLSPDTLYTLTAKEYDPGSQKWIVIARAYFRTEKPI